jgi:hypothetical protein
VGGIDFFKILFSREPEQFTLNQIELKEWLDNISQSSLKEDTSSLKKILVDAKDAKIHLKEKVDLLEKAELMNKNIPDREIHIMQGNRTNYINKVYSFIEHTKLPEPIFDKIEIFCSEFQNQLNQLTEDTAKGYFVLKNFFDSDMADIASSIKEFEACVKELKSVLNGDKVTAYRKLSAKIRELNEASIKKETMSEELKKLDDEIKATEAKKMTFETKLNNQKEGQEFQMHLKMETEKKDLEDSITKLRDRLNNIIKPLDKEIKKVSHDTENKLLEGYLENTLNALIEDNELSVLNSIEQIKKDIQSNEEIKEKQKEKLLGYANELTKETLGQIRKEYFETMNHKAMVEEILSRSSTVIDMKELEYQIEHVTEKLKRLNHDYQEKGSLLDKLKIEDRAKKLEEELSEFASKKVIIKL